MLTDLARQSAGTSSDFLPPTSGPKPALRYRRTPHQRTRIFPAGPTVPAAAPARQAAMPLSPQILSMCPLVRPAVCPRKSGVLGGRRSLLSTLRRGNRSWNHPQHKRFAPLCLSCICTNFRPAEGLNAYDQCTRSGLVRINTRAAAAMTTVFAPRSGEGKRGCGEREPFNFAKTLSSVPKRERGQGGGQRRGPPPVCAQKQRARSSCQHSIDVL